MSYIPPFLSSFAQTLGWGRRDSASSSSSSSSSAMSSTKSNGSGSASNNHNAQVHCYEPSAIDVTVTKMMLQQGLSLPAEVVLSILDFAEYWPHTSATLDSPCITSSGRDRENRFVLRTKPLGLIKKTQKDEHAYTFTPASPKALPDNAEFPLSQFQAWIGGPTDTVQHPCRKIVFTITSHDQGWATSARQDRGTYRGSYTWFEAGLERFDKSANPDEDPDEKTCNDGAPVNNIDPSADDDNTTTAESDGDMTGSYLPVHALRPIYPTVEADADPPAFHFDLLASPQYTIQCNKTATRTPTTHTVVWSWKDDVDPLNAQDLKEIGRGEETGTGEFVRNLKLGDVVTVWAKSRFAGWANHLDAMKVDIYWAL